MRTIQAQVMGCPYATDQKTWRVPSTLPEPVALPGVGRKTANVVLNVLFGYPTIPVDTHVFRVARRLGLSTGSTAHAVEHDLNRRIEIYDVVYWYCMFLVLNVIYSTLYRFDRVWSGALRALMCMVFVFSG